MSRASSGNSSAQRPVRKNVAGTPCVASVESIEATPASLAPASKVSATTFFELGSTVHSVPTSDAGSRLGWMGDGFGDGLREGEVELGEGLNVWRAVGLGGGDADVAGLCSIGRLVARVTLGFPPPLHAVPIKPRTLTTTINRFTGCSPRGRKPRSKPRCPEQPPTAVLVTVPLRKWCEEGRSSRHFEPLDADHCSYCPSEVAARTDRDTERLHTPVPVPRAEDGRPAIRGSAGRQVTPSEDHRCQACGRWRGNRRPRI